MPIKVLLVDDDDMLRKMMATLLTKQGLDVLPAENGQSALDKLKTARPDVVLLDVMMPDMDGFSVCRQIRSDPSISHIPIIMLTALDSVENKVKGFEAGADDYIAKPCDTLELVARISALLRRSEAVRPFPPPRISPRTRPNDRCLFPARRIGGFHHCSQPGSRVGRDLGHASRPCGYGRRRRAKRPVPQPVFAEHLG